MLALNSPIHSKINTAKVFMSGRSQAVRLPKAFRFDTNEVFIRKNQKGEVILSDKPTEDDWQDLYQLMMETEVPADFMADRQLVNSNRDDIFANITDDKG